MGILLRICGKNKKSPLGFFGGCKIGGILQAFFVGAHLKVRPYVLREGKGGHGGPPLRFPLFCFFLFRATGFKTAVKVGEQTREDPLRLACLYLLFCLARGRPPRRRIGSKTARPFQEQGGITGW